MKTNLELDNRRTGAPPGPGVSSGARSSSVPPAIAHSDGRTHILFIIDQLWGIGGAERNLMNIVRFLPKDRFRCSVVTFKAGQSWSGVRNFPCPLWHFPIGRTYAWKSVRCAWRIRRLIRDEQVDIVHTFFETSDLWGGVVAKLSGAPVLVSSRRDMGILRGAKHKLAYRLLGPLFDLVLTVSDEVRAYSIQHDHLRPEKVLTLYNAVELDNIDQPTDTTALRQSMGLEGTSHLISTVGHLRRVKGTDILVRAAQKVCQEFPHAVFLVTGAVQEPTFVKELETLIESLGLGENVRLVGRREDVLPLLRISNVYCLASRSEGFSNALLEAMACGVPCVATRVGGNPEAVADGRSGFLVEPEDEQSLADRILILLRDPELAQQMGREGRRIIEARFTIAAMISRLIELYGLAM